MSHPSATEADASSIEDKIRARLVISSYSNRESCPDSPTSLGSPTRELSLLIGVKELIHNGGILERGSQSESKTKEVR